MACLYSLPQRLLRIVVTEALGGDGRRRSAKRRHAAVLFSTDLSVDAATVLGWYAMRWTVEVAFHDAKQQMGMGQPQGWSAPAARPTTPSLMLLYGVVVLWFAGEGHRFHRTRRWPWYPAKQAQRVISFADMLSTLHWRMLRSSLGAANLSTLWQKAGSRVAARTILRLVRLAA